MQFSFSASVTRGCNIHPVLFIYGLHATTKVKL